MSSVYTILFYSVSRRESERAREEECEEIAIEYDKLCLQAFANVRKKQSSLWSLHKRNHDAISQVLHSSLTHIDSTNGNYVRLLFIDYSSAFNTIVPTKLAVKLSDLGLNTSLCDWI